VNKILSYFKRYFGKLNF